MSTVPAPEHVDVLIVGAGLSGIGAAARVREHLPDKRVAILESRQAMGGTWDLFRYPGVRSDSDMFTFGFHWRPWPGDVALADGQMILDYLHDVAREYAVDELIRYGHTVTAAGWDTPTARWTVTVDTAEGQRRITTDFLWCCAGYYDYEQGHQPDFPGLEEFDGVFVHPQHWPEELDHAGKRVVVIGSGATAVTLVPAMALAEDGQAVEHVTMLQRSPSYILSRSGRDPVARGLGATLGRLPKVGPLELAGRVSYEAARWVNVLLTVGSYQFARKRPAAAKKIIRDGIVRLLTAENGAAGMSRAEAEQVVEEHFTPSYEPWDQRLCFVPDGDLFEALRSGRASIATDRIRTFTARGIELESGEVLEADIVVSATGLKIKLFGGIDFDIDGERVPVGDTMSYKSLMLTGIPNFVYTVGYINASWTLKADLVSDFAVRLLRHMTERGYAEVRVDRDPDVGEAPFLDLSSGYIRRALAAMPKSGDRGPWRNRHNYLADRRVMSRDLDDDVLRFR